MRGSIGKAVLAALIAPAWLAGLPLPAWAAPAVADKAAPVPVEYDKLALAEIVRKAKAGDAAAQFELGSRFNYGRSVPKNVHEALRWLRSSAQRGHVEAQRLLALKFYHGYDITADHAEALQWASRLADAGDVPGQMMLANMYANGEGTPRQLVRAYAWYDIAAATAQQAVERGDVSLTALQDAALEQRERTAAVLLPEQEAEAQKMASDWWLQKAKVRLPVKPGAGSPSGKGH